MDEAQKAKGKVFKDLHSAEGIFVMPNAWNAGSACMLEAAGFPAVGTTSAGIAFGLPQGPSAISSGIRTRSGNRWQGPPHIGMRAPTASMCPESLTRRRSVDW